MITESGNVFRIDCRRKMKILFLNMIKCFWIDVKYSQDHCSDDCPVKLMLMNVSVEVRQGFTENRLRFVGYLPWTTAKYEHSEASVHDKRVCGILVSWDR